MFPMQKLRESYIGIEMHPLLTGCLDAVAHFHTVLHYHRSQRPHVDQF